MKLMKTNFIKNSYFWVLMRLWEWKYWLRLYCFWRMCMKESLFIRSWSISFKSYSWWKSCKFTNLQNLATKKVTKMIKLLKNLLFISGRDRTQTKKAKILLIEKERSTWIKQQPSQ